MKILVLSDLHLEFEPLEIKPSDVDVIILAGDIHLKDKGIQWALENFKYVPVIYVLGNHEFYGETYPKLINKLKNETDGTQIHILENEHVTIDGVNFLGCTLWTDFKLFGDSRLAGYECQQVMTDYKKIRVAPKYSKIRSIDIFSIHRKSRHWLANKLSELEGDANVVVTHHAPSIHSVPDHYKQNVISAAYASDLEDLIIRYSPKLWVHGHLHNSSNYRIGKTQVICNPRGYSDERNPNFDVGLTLNIDI